MIFKQRQPVPVIVEAIKACDAISHAGSAWSSLPAWLVGAYNEGNIIFLPRAVLLKTPGGGRMTADSDDWIVRGVNGEIHSCKPGFFEKTYEYVSE